jgi:3-isopropylmalate/(R)-2-methylmalate dehydratase small subunit
MSRQPFRTHTGVVAPLLRPNIDTDAIIPSREMKKVSREGLGEGLFAGWRYLPAKDGGPRREPDPDFVLNQPAYVGASILVGGRNFGCGSSREHAVWALAEYGFRVVIAPSFGAIFERNCVNNGLLPVSLEERKIEHLLAACAPDPAGRPLIVDLVSQFLRVDGPEKPRFEAPFEIPELQRKMLLDGLDPIDLSLLETASIEAWEAGDRKRRPWVYRRDAAAGP